MPVGTSAAEIYSKLRLHVPSVGTSQACLVGMFTAEIYSKLRLHVPSVHLGPVCQPVVEDIDQRCHSYDDVCLGSPATISVVTYLMNIRC